jgi:hypothetical protein
VTNTVNGKEVGAPVESCPKSPVVVGYCNVSANDNKLLRGFAYARYDDDGEPFIYNPYRRGNLTEETRFVIADAMRTLPLNERITIAKNHLSYCRNYHFLPGDHSWGLLHVTINRRTLNAGYDKVMIPVMDRLRSEFFQRNGYKGVTV